MIHEKTIIDNNNVRFSNDLFFKYLLSRDTLESIKLRKFIVKSVTHLDCQQMIVKNPEINQNTVLAKNIILDICAVDEKGRIIDIEMQMAGNSNSESTRFQFYGARLLVEQIDTGEKYHQLRPVYQIIFINEDDDRLIKDYAFRDDQGELEKENLNYRYFIKMRHIDKIIKEKGIEGLNDLERLCYLFIKNEYTAIMKEREEDIVEMVIKMYDKFRSNEPIWSLANQLALAKLRTESLEMEREEKTAKRIEEGIKQGIEQGIEIGREEGVEIGKKETLKKEKQRCIKILKKQYHQDCQEWVEGLSEKQIELIYEYIFEEDDFAVFKQKVDNTY
ncbi:Rpn family recombination-promoting nuclease/putative transposase [[Clostridium] saccharogumia]|uniref:Rpn family recombination-promoting nuclease/putative transposase n=1 Tax=Thomasclavelia saccharogumia TaxID=341225 RepID=UPI001D05D806|nr:Rpn family recombination-promoting nuclease/putative transposase [Thomasclavelia saccharogumia]MCB6706907.1 Rpn family recombination-promoting nuclease/putative transposase [Thomasclavelia saccharogumia]